MPTNSSISREQRGRQILQLENAVSRTNETDYVVKSQNGSGFYTVNKTLMGWICSCPDFMFRNTTCKHIYAVQISFNLRQEVKKKELVLEPITVSKCQSCGSQNIKSLCIRHNKSGDIQRFICQDCKKTFSFNIAFEKMKHNPKAITSAMQLYFSGESLRSTMRSLKFIGVQVSYVTVYNWIGKYCTLMESYAEKIQPQVSDHWRADEMYVKIKKDLKYVFALMDDETRYRIAQEVAHTKLDHDATSLFHKGKVIAGKVPLTLTTDGLGSYANAYDKEFKNPSRKTAHIREIALEGEVHNNKMERHNGEFRDRMKVMRSFKSMETPILTGQQIFHNFIRPHTALEGKTPAEACAIKITGEDKWKTLIQNAKVNEGKETKPRSNLEDFYSSKHQP
jgi:transposase-like protein